MMNDTNTAITIENDTQLPAFLQSQVATSSLVTDAVTAPYRTAALSKGAVDGRVSAQWSTRPDDEKFLSLDDLYEKVLARKANSETALIDPSSIRVNADAENNSLTLDMNDGKETVMTHWAFGQLCSMVKCPSDYLRRLPAQLAGINLQHGLVSRPTDADMKAYTYQNGNTSLRAMTAESYGRIYDHEVIEQVQKIAGNGIGDTRWKIPGVIDWQSSNGFTVEYNPFVDITKENTTLYASDRDVYVFLVDDTHPIEIGKLPNGEPDLLFRGFIVWNSEVGAKSFGMCTMLLRGVCQNRNIWGVEASNEIRIRHSRMAPDRFAREAGPMLLEYSNASTDGIINKVTNAKLAIVAKDDEERIDFLTKKVGLTKTLSDRVLATVLREEHKPAQSIWDMVQGMTAVARSYQHQDARLTLEQQAGKLMDKVSA